MQKAWNSRAVRLNVRPTVGDFQDFLERLFEAVNDFSTGSTLRVLLKEKCETVCFRFMFSFKRFKNPKNLYGSTEHVYLDVPVNHKFYFHKNIPFSIFLSLFGIDEDYDMFGPTKLKSKRQKKEQTPSIFVQENK